MRKTQKQIQATLPVTLDAIEPEAESGPAFSRETAIATFKEATATWHTASLGVVASAAVVFIAGTAEGKAPIAIVAELEAAVKERGLKKAQVYRYLGLAKALFLELARGPAAGATNLAILDADSPKEAVDAILAWCSNQKIVSLDRLGLRLGVYARSAKRNSVEREAPEPNAQIAPALAKMQVAEVASILRTAETDPVDLVDAIADRVNAEALNRMISKLQGRLDQLTRNAPGPSPWLEGVNDNAPMVRHAAA